MATAPAATARRILCWTVYRPEGVTLASVNVGQRQWRTAGFAQDNFKSAPNLTLIFGIRYEFDEPWVEEQDRTGNINLTTGQIDYAGHLPAGALPGAGICSNLACYQPNYRQWMPHLGAAYQLNDRTVIRGGYGATSFFEGNSFNQRLTAIAPFLQAAGFSVSAPTRNLQSVPTPNTAEEGFTDSDTSIQYSSSNNGYTAYPQNIQPAYVQEYNLTVEYALTHTASLQAGYVGETGQHIEDYGNVNQLTVNNDQTSAPFYNSPYIGVNGIDSALGVGGNGGLLITESRAMMNYNALQVVLRQRLSHGLEYTVNYTYGKAMTNSLGNYSFERQWLSAARSRITTTAAPTWIRPGTTSSTTSPPPPSMRSRLDAAKNTFPRPTALWTRRSAAGNFPPLSSPTPDFPEVITGGRNNSNSYGSSRVNQYRKLKVAGRSNEELVRHRPLGSSLPQCGIGQRQLRIRRARQQRFRHLKQRRRAWPRLLQRGHVGIQGLQHCRRTLDRFSF